MVKLYGYDISGWQDKTPLLNGLDFIIARSSIGLSKDSRYNMHETNARKAGKDVGAYHFITFGPSGAAQAGVLLASAKRADFLAVDVEANATDRQGADMIKTLQDHDTRFILRYASLSRQIHQGQDGNWTAYWGGQVPSALILQSWSPDARPLPRPPECPASHDFNVFQGTLEQYTRMLGHNLPAEGETMGNLFPITTHRAASLKKGVKLYKDLSLTKEYTTLPKDINLGVIDAYPLVYKVANGDASVFVRRKDAPIIVIIDKHNGI